MRFPLQWWLRGCSAISEMECCSAQSELYSRFGSHRDAATSSTGTAEILILMGEQVQLIQPIAVGRNDKRLYFHSFRPFVRLSSMIIRQMFSV